MHKERFALPILLLLLTVLVPSAGVMWMMREAVRNERVATNQRLLDAYRLQLDQAARTLKDRWSMRLKKLSGQVVEGRPAYSFSKIATTASVDSVVVCHQSGEVAYPDSDRAADRKETRNDPQWLLANRLEFVERDYVKAAEAYGEIIASYLPPPPPAGDQFRGADSLAAILAKARCLDKAGERKGAIKTFESVSGYAVDGARGLSHQCSAYLRLLELAKKDSNSWRSASRRLELHLLDYEKYPMRSHQRCFLMNEFEQLTGESGKFPTHEAESLASKYVGQLNDGNIKLPGGLRLTTIPGVWQDYEQGTKLASLYRTETVRKSLQSLCDELPLSEGMAFSVTAPGETSNDLMNVSLGPRLGDWQLGLKATGGDPFHESSNHQNAVYIWIAALTVAATCVLGWLLLAALHRRMRLAQLKNDLVATVSHELKTPLASIRLLVDTLLQDAEDNHDPNAETRTGEYLRLISAENARLTRLIDNFLTFSRMERGQQRASFSDIDSGELIQEAINVFLDHCPESSDCLTVQLEQVAAVQCNGDSMVTAIVNLLENAWKYGGNDKRVEITSRLIDEDVEISVHDDGIGLTAREIDQVFDRFYQVDQRVARTQGGCGLGLSIVRSIVEAHGGSVHVVSQPGEGSTFTLRLPRAK